MAVWPAKREVLLALAQDFVDDGGGDAVAAEAADGEVIAVVDQAAHGVGDGGQLVGQGARLAGEERRARVGGGIGEERAAAGGRGSMEWSVIGGR